MSDSLFYFIFILIECLGYEDERDDDPYEDRYDPAPYAPYAPSPIPADQGAYSPSNDYYPPPGNFAPPPGPAPIHPNTGPSYNPADYPPPPGAGPPGQSYAYPPPPGAGPMASGARRGDDIVSAPMMPAPSTEERHIPAGGLQGYVSDVGKPTNTVFAGLKSGSTASNPWGTSRGLASSPDDTSLVSSPLASAPPNSSTPTPSRPRSSSQPVPPQSKSVAFDLGSRDSTSGSLGDPEPSSPYHAADHGYETDDSDSTLDDSYRRQDRRHRSSGRHRSTYPPTPAASSSRHHRSTKSSNRDRRQSDSDSTVDLPARFDSEGGRKYDDPADKIEGFLNRLVNGAESSRKRRSTRH